MCESIGHRPLRGRCPKEGEGEISPMCESIGHRPLWSRCPKGEMRRETKGATSVCGVREEEKMDERIEKELYIYIDDAISSLMIWPYISVTRNTPLFLFHTFVVPSLFYHPLITSHIDHRYYPYSFPLLIWMLRTDGRSDGRARQTNRQTYKLLDDLN